MRGSILAGAGSRPNRLLRLGTGDGGRWTAEQIPQIEKLLDEIVRMTGESKAEAVRKALEERSRSLVLQSGRGRDGERLLDFLADEIWPLVPPELAGSRWTKAEEEEVFGYGETGL